MACNHRSYPVILPGSLRKPFSQRQRSFIPTVLLLLLDSPGFWKAPPPIGYNYGVMTACLTKLIQFEANRNRDLCTKKLEKIRLVSGCHSHGQFATPPSLKKYFPSKSIPACQDWDCIGLSTSTQVYFLAKGEVCFPTCLDILFKSVKSMLLEKWSNGALVSASSQPQEATTF